MSDNEQSDWRNSTIDAAEAREHPETAEAVQAIERLRGAQIGQWKARAGFAPADNEREHSQIARLRTLAEQAGLDPDIAESYHTFVVSESKTRHERIAAQS